MKIITNINKNPKMSDTNKNTEIKNNSSNDEPTSTSNQNQKSAHSAVLNRSLHTIIDAVHEAVNSMNTNLNIGINELKNLDNNEINTSADKLLKFFINKIIKDSSHNEQSHKEPSHNEDMCSVAEKKNSHVSDEKSNKCKFPKCKEENFSVDCSDEIFGCGDKCYTKKPTTIPKKSTEYKLQKEYDSVSKDELLASNSKIVKDITKIDKEIKSKMSKVNKLRKQIKYLETKQQKLQKYLVQNCSQLNNIINSTEIDSDDISSEYEDTEDEFVDDNSDNESE